MDVFNNVKAKCDEQKIGVNALERECGFTAGTIYKWKNSIPRADRLQKAADRLNCSVAELLKEGES